MRNEENEDDLKFFIWGRKIAEEVERLEENEEFFGDIRKYLKLCSKKRKYVLDAHNLTDVEYRYTTEILPRIFIKYGVVDEIFEIVN